VPQVVITLRAGRSDDEIRSLLTGVTDAVVEAIDVPPERVRVVVHELDGSRIAVGGIVSADAHRS
jgi:4-oxalocrotonate tautomerase